MNRIWNAMVSNSKTVTLASAVVFVICAALPAKADVFALTVGTTSTGGLSSYGQVQAINVGSNLQITVTLAPGVYFNNGSAPNPALLFNLDNSLGNPISSFSFTSTGAPAASLNGGAANTSVVSGTGIAGSFAGNPFTAGSNPNFEFAIMFNGGTHGNTAASEFNQLSFTIQNMQVANLESDQACNT